MAYIKCLRNVISSTIPDGKTVTPTDVVATWLACGSRTEEYTTLSAVLADSTCLNALMASDNAVDYLVRSTTFASDITSDSGAMTAIGLNNYCANTLLGDSDWCEAICNSTYFESVLNVKVPTMTSDTTPSGEVIYSSQYSSYYGYRAFNGDNASNGWMPDANTERPWSSHAWCGYDFGNSIMVKKGASSWKGSNSWTAKIKYQGYDGSDWVDLDSEKTMTQAVTTNYSLVGANSNETYQKFRVVLWSSTDSSYTSDGDGYHFQFYGRADV